MSRHYATLTTVQQHLQRGKPDQARAALQRAIQKDPADPDLNNAMAVALVHLGQRDQALYFAQRAAKARPDDPAILGTLGGLLAMADRPAEAIPLLERSCAVGPGAPDVLVSLANAYRMTERFVAAARTYRLALDHSPGNADLISREIQSLMYAGQADRAVEVAREARPLAPAHLDLARVVAYALNYVGPREPGESLRAHVDFARLVESSPRTRPTRRALEGSPLRLGLLSPDLRAHPVANFIEPLLRHRDRTRLEAVCFMSDQKEDSVSDALRPLADAWHNVATLSDDDLAALIRRERIDALIDLAGLTGGNRLAVFARRPAPLQGTYLGYPNTTGLSSVDVRLVDSITDPAGSDAACVERLLRLDPCFLCFQPARDAPEPAAPPSAAAGFVTFASFNTLLKLSDRSVAAWARILQRVPGSRLILKCTQVSDPEVRELTRRRFAALGIDPERLEMLTIAPSPREHLALYARADIALDPFPYNGTTTTCEALWMGVPVVTLRGDVHATRVGASILANIGQADLVASDLDDYVERAAALAADGSRLRALRSTLRDSMSRSPLRDGAGLASRVERALREAYAAL